MKAKNYKEWNPERSGFPEHDRLEQIRFLLRFAILAPSGHNMQPWNYQIDRESESLIVRLEHSRLLHASDPTDRISYLAVGGTSQCFVRAAESYGLATGVTIEQTGADYQVRIRIEGPYQAGGEKKIDWIDAILRRVSNRTLFLKEPIDQNTRNRMTNVDIPDVNVKPFTSSEHKNIIAKLTDTCSRKLINTKDFREELAGCIHNNEGGRKLGLPARSLGFPALLAPFATFIIRHANVGSAIARMSTKQLTAAPMIVAVTTEGDTPYHWIRAGMAHLDVFLRATVEGFSVDTFAAATMDTREELAGKLGIDKIPQILFRVGKSTKAPSRAPRLSVEEVLS